MTLLLGVVAGLAVGLVRWRGFGYLTQLGWRHGWIFLLALAIQLVSLRLVEPGPPGEVDVRGGLFLLGYLGVLVGVVVNRHLPPMWVLGLGFALNLAAILPQWGYMPITREAYVAAGLARPGDDLTDGVKLARAKDVILPREQTPLWPLTDILVVSEPRWLRGVYSPGDLALALGAAWLASGVWFLRVNRTPSTPTEQLSQRGGNVVVSRTIE